MSTLSHSVFFCPVCEQEKDITEQYRASQSKFILCQSCAATGRHCPRCEKYKAFSSFVKGHGTHRGGAVGYCLQCKHDRYKETYTPGKYRSYRLKTRFNLTSAEYDTMFALQGGVCAICHKPETAMDNTGKKVRALATDHDHETGAIRGLLCGFCNYLLGYVKDNAELLQAANEYLRKHNKLPHEWPKGGRLL